MDLAWERKIISEKVETIPRDRCAEITFRIVARSGNGLFPKKKKGKKREKELERYKIATLKLFSSLFVRQKYEPSVSRRFHPRCVTLKRITKDLIRAMVDRITLVVITRDIT